MTITNIAMNNNTLRNMLAGHNAIEQRQILIDLVSCGKITLEQYSLINCKHYQDVFVAYT